MAQILKNKFFLEILCIILVYKSKLVVRKNKDVQAFFFFFFNICCKLQVI